METTFDHKKKSLGGALGLDTEDIHQVNTKLANMSKHVIMTTCKQSELCEYIAQNFSYNELLLIGTLYVVDKTAQIIEENPQMVTLLMLQKFMKEERQ